jgi:hypothetical protein
VSKEPTAPLSSAAARTQLLIERLGRGKQLYRDFTWPGGKLPCRLRMLSNSELQLATAGAVKRWADLDCELSALLANDFADEVVTQRLWLGLEDPERPIDGDRFGRCLRLFDTVDEFRDLTTAAERAAVFDAYVDLEEETDPSPTVLDEATRKRIEDAVKKKDETGLKGFGSSTLRLYLLTTGSPPES